MPEPPTPSQLELARLVAGELPPEEARRVEEAALASPEARQRLEALRAHVAEYEQVAPRQLAALRQRLEAEGASSRVPFWRRPLVVLAPLAAAAAAVMLVLVLRAPPPGPEDAVRFKGALAVRVVARRGESQLVVQVGSELAAGDVLRFVVTVPAPGYLTVFSVDGRGELSPFYPETDPAKDARPLRLERAGQHELPGSVTLDDAPGPERLFVVFSPEPFERAPLHARARELARRGAAVSAAALGIQGAVERIDASKRAGAPR
jgi:hypothetical protein